MKIGVKKTLGINVVICFLPHKVIHLSVCSIYIKRDLKDLALHVLPT